MISQETIDTCITFQFKSYGIHMSRGITHLIFAPLLVLNPFIFTCRIACFALPLVADSPFTASPKVSKPAAQVTFPFNYNQANSIVLYGKPFFEGRVNY